MTPWRDCAPCHSQPDGARLPLTRHPAYGTSPPTRANSVREGHSLPTACRIPPAMAARPPSSCRCGCLAPPSSPSIGIWLGPFAFPYPSSMVSTTRTSRFGGFGLNKKHAGIDGTELFEQLCAEVASRYFGDGSRSFVFGTSSDTRSFSDRVKALCQQIGEGSTYKNRSGGNPQAKDDGLDVVVWNPFNDARQGKLIGFGQCKTGTHYEEHFTRLKPDAFCKNWFDSMPAVDPVRMFFITDELPEDRWYKRSTYAGILFDRSRVIELCQTISSQTLAYISAWTRAAAIANGLPAV